MPKRKTDFSKTIVYKIACIDESSKDVYIDFTTNLAMRKSYHKQNYYTLLDLSGNYLSIYKTIKENGGWDNWNITEMRRYNCVDVFDARNKVNRIRKVFEENKSFFFCKTCNFECWKISNWERHNSTKKHIQLNEDGSDKEVDDVLYDCECGKQYKYKSSLCAHRKKCSLLKTTDLSAIITKELVIELIKQNQDIQQLMLENTQNLQNTFMEHAQTTQNQLVELAKTQHSIQTNNIQNNTHFSINIFLNQDCKDAIDINQFTESIQVSVSDFIATGQLGHVGGIARIINNRLRELDIYKRPIHCTDAKRETIYIKDKDGWEKEPDDKPRFREVVKKVTRKNLCQLPVWQAQNPRFVQLDTDENQQFIQLSLAALGAEACSENQDVEKIMKNVSKEIIIDKKIKQFDTGAVQ